MSCNSVGVNPPKVPLVPFVPSVSLDLWALFPSSTASSVSRSPTVASGHYPHLPLSTVSNSSSKEIDLQLIFSYSKAVGSGSLRNLKKLGSPSFLVDGTPSVLAPDSVVFQLDEWKDHLLAHFHGSPPSPSKIFSNLNPI